MRVVIELRRDVNPQIVQNQLFKHTQMQTTFGAIMLALVDGVPRVLPLKQILAHYLAHRKVVVTRRTEYELRKAKARAHILEGLKTALRSEEHTSELQSRRDLVCRLLLEKKKHSRRMYRFMPRYTYHATPR